MQWADGASATLVHQGETVRIGYRWPDGDGWRTAVQTVRLMAHRPHLGGTCFYLACFACGRRVAKLFDLGGRFMCRHCGGLANRSQSEGAWVRALRRASRIRRRLGAAGGAGDPLPPRPKWMRTRTHQTLCAELRALEAIPLAGWLSDGRGVALGIRRSRMGAKQPGWLSDGRGVALGIRRSRMGAKQRCRWWPARNHRTA